MLPRIFSEIFGGVWLIDKATADSYMPLVISVLRGDFQKNGIDFFNYKPAIQENNLVYSIFENGQSNDQTPEKAPENSIAVLDITDVISKYNIACGPLGMKTKGNLLTRAYVNPNIKGVILNIDSGGGSGLAMRHMTNLIDQRNKPVLAFVDDMAASAAYGIAASTDWVVANSNIAKIGSIGTYITIADYAEHWKQEGVRLIEVYADKSKDKNKEYYDAIKGDTSGIKEMANRFNEEFIESIKKYRGSKLPDESVWGTGKLFDADQVNGSLVDEIATWQDTVTSFAQSLNLL